MIDQFIVAAADKWGQHSSLSLLLPHGFEGQGPEHSSARIERYLILCAERNLPRRVPSTAAQYFHALRRQAIAVEQIPLVCFTPKRYLRMPHTHSTRDDLTNGAFEFVLDDRAELDRDAVARVLVCTGKIGHELMDERDTQHAPAAVLRIEQLYPWPESRVVAAPRPLPQRQAGVVGAGGAGEHGRVELHPHPPAPRAAASGRSSSTWPRAPSASPASGSSKVHDAEQRALLAAAFAKL